MTDPGSTGYASRCLVCLGPDVEMPSPDGRNLRVDCETHGHFEVTRTLWDAIARMTPVEKRRLFFQSERHGSRRLRLPLGAPDTPAVTPRRRHP